MILGWRLSRGSVEELDSYTTNCNIMINRLQQQAIEVPRFTRGLRKVSQERRQALVDRTDPTAIVEGAEAFLRIADDAHNDSDYHQERQLLILAEQTLQRAPEAAVQSSDSAIRLSQVRVRRIRFEQCTTHSAYFHAYAITQLSIPLQQQNKGLELIRLVNDLLRIHPNLDLPWLQYAIFSHAAMVRDGNEQQNFIERRDIAARRCPWAQSRTDNWYCLTPDARNHPVHYQKQVYHTDDCVMLYNEIRLLIHWTSTEVAAERLTANELSEMLGITANMVAEYPRPGEYDLLDKTPHATTTQASIFLYGTPLRPTSADHWNTKLKLIETWLRERLEEPSEAARHWLLKNLQLSRRWILRKNRIDNHNSGQVVSDDVWEWLVDANDQYRRILGSIVEEATAYGDAVDATAAHMESIENITRSNSAIRDGRVTNDMLRLQMSALGADLCSHYLSEGKISYAYLIFRQRANAAWTSYHLLRCLPDSVGPDHALQYLESADDLYCRLRRNNSASQITRNFDATSFQTQIAALNRLGHHAAYILALLSCGAAYTEALENAETGAEAVDLSREIDQLSLWTEKSKARTLLDELGIGARLPSRFLNDGGLQDHQRNALRDEKNLIDRYNLAQQNNDQADQIETRQRISTLQEQMRTDPLLQELIAIRDGTPVTPGQIQELLGREKADTVISTFIEIGDARDLWRLDYRYGFPVQVTNTRLTLLHVQAWVGYHMRGDSPLSTNESIAHLLKLQPLLEKLDRVLEAEAVLVICPTQQLHHLPFHALSMDNQTLAERNAVAYCQSLSVLQRCEVKAKQEARREDLTSKTLILGTHESTWTAATTFASVGRWLDTTPMLQPHVAQEVAEEAIQDTTLFHFQGHCISGLSQPLAQYLSLGTPEAEEEDYDDPFQSEPEESKLTASSIFSLTLHPACLVVLVACHSGYAQITDTNDLVGLNTMLFYAGATCVISTLWPIRVEDGVKFTELFYGTLEEEVRERISQQTRSQDEGENMIDIALVLSRTVTLLKRDVQTEGDLSPYRWAGFTVNGYWKVPLSFFPPKRHEGVE